MVRVRAELEVGFVVIAVSSPLKIATFLARYFLQIRLRPSGVICYWKVSRFFFPRSVFLVWMVVATVRVSLVLKMTDESLIIYGVRAR